MADDKPIKPERVVAELARHSMPDAIIVADAGTPVPVFFRLLSGAQSPGAASSPTAPMARSVIRCRRRSALISRGRKSNA